MKSPRRWIRKWKEVLIWIGLLLPLALYGYGMLTRPAGKTINQQPLFEGITYSRYTQQLLRPQLIHLLEIELEYARSCSFCYTCNRKVKRYNSNMKQLHK
jgi:hypothetical protein